MLYPLSYGGIMVKCRGFSGNSDSQKVLVSKSVSKCYWE